MTATTDRPSNSKLAKPVTTCGYRRNEPPQQENMENTADCLKRKEQPRNEKGQLSSPIKLTDKPIRVLTPLISDLAKQRPRRNFSAISLAIQISGN